MQIDQVELNYLSLDDYQELVEAMKAAYPAMPDDHWELEQLKRLVERFPEGQVVIKVDGKLAGCALSIRVKETAYNSIHTYNEIIADYSFDTHSDEGDLLYGIEIFIKPKFRGLRLGRRLYDYRKELCEKLNLKGIAFGGRIPNYHPYKDKLSPRKYLDKVRKREIEDPVLNFQLSNDFRPTRVLKGYLEGDTMSNEYAVLMRWDNIYYEKPTLITKSVKSVVRLGLIQWQMRPYENLDELMQQAEYFVDAVSGYRSDFALFPEFFNAPLMAPYNDLGEAKAIRKLAEYTEDIMERFSELAVSYNINIITGSMPLMVRNKLVNAGYLCHRDGRVDRFEKLHVTPDEASVWGMQGSNQLQTFETDAGNVGILICYDVEFPELSRLLADEGMQLLFVPFLTDTQNGYSRVRNCARARAIENECYVAIAGSVGNLPRVDNMDIQYAQSAVFTPCDFAFASDGVKAEATPNTEMNLIVDVDLDHLRELHNYGSVRNLKDRRLDLYELRRK